MKIEYPTIDVKATGERIKELRKKSGLTIREVSEYMGFTTDQAVCKWQRGDSLPTVDNLYALSRLYGISMEDILVGNDEMSSRYFRGRRCKLACLHVNLTPPANLSCLAKRDTRGYTYSLMFKKQNQSYAVYSDR